jgi:mono/diheme cytochrome c family protein
MKWIVRILGGLLVVVCVAVLAIFVASNRIINKRHAFQEHPLTVPSDSASVAEGERFARIRCMGCHSDSLKGKVFFDEPMIARLIAPNVPAKIATLSDAEFAGFLRSGVRKDGTSPFVMPPPGFYHISDQDLGALIAYIRSLPVGEHALPANSYRLMGRLGITMGQFRTAVANFDTTEKRVGDDPAWATTRKGEYLARIQCTECHGLRLTGEPAPEGEAGTPSLSGALGYSPDEFVRLLRTGTPRDTTRKLTLMAEVAQGGLTHLTDEEIAAVYGYLKTLPVSGVK